MDVFLVIAFIGLCAATINDIKKREVADWISYSLLATLVALTLIYSIIQLNFYFLIKAVCYMVILYGLGNLLYYAKLIGGGDVKLLTAISPVFISFNIFNFLAFIVLASGVYGIIYSVILACNNWKKMKMNLRYNFLIVLSLIFLVLGLMCKSIILVIISVVFLAPYIVIFVSTVEKVALVKFYPASKLTEGDWLIRDVKIKGKWIRATADGLTKKDIALIKKARAKVWIKEGIPYVPVLLIAFILANLISVLELIKAFF
jgi:Flp pilus assembly protein protease CpaA